MTRKTKRKFTVHVPWTVELRGGNRFCDLTAAVENARQHGVPNEAQVFAKTAFMGGSMLRLTFVWEEAVS